MSSRLVAPQLCPPTRAKFEPFTTAAAAMSQSTSSKIKMGFLPPSSRVTLLRTPDAPARGLHGQPGAQRAGERHPGHVGVPTRASPAAAPPGTTLSTPSGSRSGGQRGNHQRRQGSLFRRLEHHRVARSQCGCGLHAGEEGGMVVGANRADHAPRRGSVSAARRGWPGWSFRGVRGPPPRWSGELAALGRAGRHGGDRRPARRGVEQAQPGRGLRYPPAPLRKPGRPLVDSIAAQAGWDRAAAATARSMSAAEA